jgi:hypothetical protein
MESIVDCREMGGQRTRHRLTVVWACADGTRPRTCASNLAVRGASPIDIRSSSSRYRPREHHSLARVGKDPVANPNPCQQDLSELPVHHVTV